MRGVLPLCVTLLAPMFGVLQPGEAQGAAEVVSEHEALKLKKGKRAPEYHRWTASTPLEIDAEGPTVIELKLRPVLSGKKGEVLIRAERDATHASTKTLKVRRVKTKAANGRVPRKDMRVHLAVPEGEHEYTLTYSGDAIEVLVVTKTVKRAKRKFAMGAEEELPPPEPPEAEPEPEPETTEAAPAVADAGDAEGTPEASAEGAGGDEGWVTPGAETTAASTDGSAALAASDAAAAADASTATSEATAGDENAGEGEAAEAEAEAEKPSVAVFQVAGKAGFEQDRCDMFSEFLQHNLRQRGHRVIGDSDITAILGLESAKGSMSCTDASCMAELGGALGVDEMVTGAIATMGPYLMITLKRIDALNASVVSQAAYKIDDKVEGALADSINPVVDALYGKSTTGATGAGSLPVSVRATEDSGPGALPITLWIATGVAVATGAVFTVLAKGHADNANDPEYVGRQTEIGATESAQLISFVAYGVAGAAAVAGTALWLLGGSSPEESTTVTVAPSIHQEGAGVALNWQF